MSELKIDAMFSQADPVLGMGRAMPVMSSFYAIKAEYEQVLEMPLGPDREASLHELHISSAKKCLEVARTNGGIYNKAAQFVASLQGGAGDKGIPKEYIEVLRVCTDNAPFKSFKEMDEVFLEDFGQSAKEIFAEIDEIPIAAASLAQVHRAMLKNGLEVAVKVQYPNLRKEMAADFNVLETLGSTIKPGGYDLEWLVKDFKRALSDELDFEHEAQNTERVAINFRHRVADECVCIPKVQWNLTSKRILTMEFIRNMVKVNDPNAIANAGMNVLEVGRILAGTFAEMVCCHGFVHGDPHQGNVYVKKHPTSSRPQLIILDHGLYHEVPKHTRLRLCELLKACICRDSSSIKILASSFAGDNLYRFFPLILSPWFVFGGDLTREDIDAARAGRLPDTVKYQDIADFLVGLHTNEGDMLGVLHSMGYTRGLLNDLGTNERIRLHALGQAAVLGFNTVDIEEEVKKIASTGLPDGSAPFLSSEHHNAMPSLSLTLKLQIFWIEFQVDLLSIFLSLAIAGASVFFRWPLLFRTAAKWCGSLLIAILFFFFIILALLCNHFFRSLL